MDDKTWLVINRLWQENSSNSRSPLPAQNGSRVLEGVRFVRKGTRVRQRVKVSALEVEEAIGEHPAVREVAVVGLPDPEWGERIGAALVLAPGEALTLEELRRWAGDRLAPYKLPTRLLTLEGLPRNAMGKVTKPDVVRLFTDLHLRRHRQDRGRLQGRSDRAQTRPGVQNQPKRPPARRALTRGRLEAIGVRFAPGGAIVCRDVVPT